MSLPDVLAAFPNAKIIGAELSQEKLKFVNAIDKYHYLSTDSDDLAKANEQLKGKVILEKSLGGRFLWKISEIWAGFWPVDNTEKKIGPIMSKFWGQFFHVFMVKK